MYRSVLASLSLASLALLFVVPCGAQQPAPAVAPTPRALTTPLVQQQDCPKVIGEINALTAVRFDPAAANAKQVAANASKLQADGKYAECFSTAQATRDLLIPTTAVAVYPDNDDPVAWAHPDEDISWVRRPQRP